MNLPKFAPKAAAFLRSSPEAETVNPDTLEKFLSAALEMAHSHYSDFCAREINAHAATCEDRRVKELGDITKKLQAYQATVAEREAINANLSAAKLQHANYQAAVLNTQVAELKGVIAALKMTREEATAVDSLLFPKPKE
jgi:hypothetical protein